MEPGKQGAGSIDGHVEGDAGIQLVERGQELRNQIDSDEGGGTEVQGALFQIIDLPQLLLGVLPGGKKGAGIGHESLAVYGQQGFLYGSGTDDREPGYGY